MGTGQAAHGFDRGMDDLDKHRWERLLRWLSDDHGMDVSAAGFHVEAREVQGA